MPGGAWAKGSIDKYADVTWGQTGNSAAASMSRAVGPNTTLEYARRAGAAGVDIKGSKALPWPGKAQAQSMAKWKMLATPTSIAKSLVAPETLLTLAAGMAITYALDQACVRLMGGSMQLASGGQWEECTQGASTTGTNYNIGTSNSSGSFHGTKYPHKDAACNVTDMQAFLNSPAAGQSAGIHYVAGSRIGTYTDSSTQCQFNYQQVRNSDGVVVFNSVQPIAFESSTVTVPGGASWGTASAAEVQAKLATTMGDLCQAGDSRCESVVRELMENGGKVQTDDAQAEPALEGPASSEGETTTEVQHKADGSTVTITNQTTNSFTYEGNKVTNNQTTMTTTTTLKPDGTTTTETTQKQKEELPDPCQANPDSLSCAKFGDVPSSDALANTPKTMTVTPVPFAAGSCPSPIAFSAYHRSYSFDYAPLCAKLATVALLFQALAAFGAAWILADAFKVS